MKNNRVGFFALSMVWALAALTLSMRGASPPEPASRRIPEPLKAWETWATWGAQHRDCPTPYSDPKKHLCFWPSRLNLEAGKAGGRFAMAATVFHEACLPLPGGPLYASRSALYRALSQPFRRLVMTHIHVRQRQHHFTCIIEHGCIGAAIHTSNAQTTIGINAELLHKL